MQIDHRAIHAEMRLRQAQIQKLLEAEEPPDNRALLRLIASLDYYQRLAMAELAPEPNGPRSLVRAWTRQSPLAWVTYLGLGTIGWLIGKGHLTVSQAISWFLGRPPS